MKNKIRCIENSIRRGVKGERAIIAVSGGIDSSVCLVLSNKAIPNRLYPVFIDNGFILDNEEKGLLKLCKRFNIKLRVLRRQKLFFNALKDVEDNMKRRKAFGCLSLELLKKYADKTGAACLINGVNKNDKLVSNAINSPKKRKEHVKKILGLKLIEPIADLYKEEIKGIAKKIGLKHLVNKQHIPGPALSVRIAGKITRKKIDIIKKAAGILNNEIEKRNLNKKIWQYFPFLLNEKIHGKYAVVLRIVSSKDGMRAEPVFLQEGIFRKISRRIAKEVPEIGRVMYDITRKPPAKIEFM